MREIDSGLTSGLTGSGPGGIGLTGGLGIIGGFGLIGGLGIMGGLWIMGVTGTTVVIGLMGILGITFMSAFTAGMTGFKTSAGSKLPGISLPISTRTFC